MCEVSSLYCYEMTPLYDVLSAYPLLGNGANQLAPHDAKLAMAVRGKNTHWHMGRIMRRHWNAMARRCGLRISAEELIESIIEKTPRVVAAIEHSLPHDFPAVVAEPTLSGLISRMEQFARMPAN